jgi:hypothetical protein
MSFTPAEFAAEIKRHVPGFHIIYSADDRQPIAARWPGSMDDLAAWMDWEWKAKFGMEEMVLEMLGNV